MLCWVFRVELLARNSESKIGNKYNFSQTMMRVKDIDKSIAFYEAVSIVFLVFTFFFSNFFLTMYPFTLSLV